MMTASLFQPEQDVNMPALPECHRHSCQSLVPHPPIPAWLTPETSDWQKLVRRVGIQEAVSRRQVYLHGFRDSQGNHWCGQCFWKYRLMEVGEHLAYPALPLACLQAGYDAWLTCAQEASFAVIEDVVRAASQLEVPL